MEAEAELIRREVIDKGRNALMVYGDMHLPRKPLFYPVSDREFAEFAFNHPSTVSTVAHLEAANVRVFSIFAYTSDDFIAVQPEVESWTMPALAVVPAEGLGTTIVQILGCRFRGPPFDVLIEPPRIAARSNPT